MFNRNTFLQHTTNASSHNKMTGAGVKAPFSLNEQFYLNEAEDKQARLNRIKPYDYDEYGPVHREGMRVHGEDSVIHAPIHAAIQGVVDNMTKIEIRGVLGAGEKSIAGHPYKRLYAFPIATAYNQAFRNAQEAGRHASENPDDEIHHPHTASFVNVKNTREFARVMPRMKLDEIMRDEMQRSLSGGH